MDYYIAQYKPELIQIASNLKVDAKEYLGAAELEALQ